MLRKTATQRRKRSPGCTNEAPCLQTHRRGKKQADLASRCAQHITRKIRPVLKESNQQDLKQQMGPQRRFAALIIERIAKIDVASLDYDGAGSGRYRRDELQTLDLIETAGAIRPHKNATRLVAAFVVRARRRFLVFVVRRSMIVVTVFRCAAVTFVTML